MVPKAITGWQGKRWKALEGPGRPWNDLLPQDLQGSKAYKYSVPAHCRFCSVVENIDSQLQQDQHSLVRVCRQYDISITTHVDLYDER